MLQLIEIPPSDPHDMRELLIKEVEKAIERFPQTLDKRLHKGLERLIVNSSKDFVAERSFSHLRALLLTQFFLQRDMEAFPKKEDPSQRKLSVKLFKQPSIICAAFIFPSSSTFQRQQLLKALYSLLPGIHETPRSFYLWHHPELCYEFCYLEVYKLRGKELSNRELKIVEKLLQEQLSAMPPLTSALFWPYNEEESYRQIQLLHGEMKGTSDLPHLSMHFQEQTLSSLEFLIHIVRPKSEELLTDALERLPSSLQVSCRFHRLHSTPFPIEVGAFSLRVPSHAFDVRGSINLLYARRYVLKYIESAIGPFRDYNGGLFEKQQQHFEVMRIRFSDKITHFDLFAEKLFYALHPVEKRLALSLEEAEELFYAFSKLMQGKESFCSKRVFVMRAASSAACLAFSKSLAEFSEASCHAQLMIGNFHCFCMLSSKAMTLESVLQENTLSPIKTQTLYLSFQEGAPLSLNPYHSYGDMRCRVLSKLLFEGLMRLNSEGMPEPAGAAMASISENGLLYTFKLRPNSWSNGESVTAVDFAASWTDALTQHMSHPEFLFAIKNAQAFKENRCNSSKLGIRVIDAETLQIELERSDPHFLSKLAQPFFFPLFGSMREPRWFNGPYLVREQNKQRLLLERNPYFWDVKHSSFEYIEIKWQDSLENIYALFKEGKIDWIGDPISYLSPALIAQLESEKMLRQQKVGRRFLLYFNTNQPALISPKIRRALSLAIDRLAICTIFPHSMPLSPERPDLEEARHLFKEGLEELGLSLESFPPLTFSYSHQTGRERLAASLQSTWQTLLGIEVRTEKKQWNVLRNDLEKGVFEITGLLQDTLENDSFEFLERFEQSNSWNFSKWSHPAYSTLIAKAKEETDEQMQKEILSQAENLLAQHTPFTPLFSYTHLYAHPPGLEGYLFDHEGCVDFSGAHFKFISNKGFEGLCGKKSY